MKIGIDAKRIFNNNRGLGSYGRTLLDNMIAMYPNDKFVLYTPAVSLPRYQSLYDSMENIAISTADGQNGVLWRSYGIAQNIINDEIDVYHGLSHELPRNIGAASSKSVVTIHDLIFKTHPAYFPATDRFFYNLKWKHSLDSADKIIAISHSTAADIQKYYDVDSDKIEVIYSASHPRYYSREAICRTIDHLKLPSEYMLSVGSLEPRKNYEGLIRAYANVNREVRVPLVIVGGGKKAYHKKLRALISRLDLDDLVFIRTDVDDDSLPGVYHKAKLFVYPSHYEGHGLPINEAMLCSTAVVASQTSSMQEAGGPSTLYVNPDDIDDIRVGIEAVLESEALRDDMVAKGLVYVHSHFDPKKVTTQTVELYQSLL